MAGVAGRLGVSQRQCSSGELLSTPETGTRSSENLYRKIYNNREEARRDIFDYIELFYNSRRRHGHAGSLAPVEFEKQYFNRLESVY